MKKIAVIGADGQLGTDLVAVLQQEQQVIPLYYPEFDLLQPDSIRLALNKLHPDVVINTAAYNKVDEAELEPVACFQLNAFAVRDLALICRDISAGLIHFSSDYVFDGRQNKPYLEENNPAPLSAYGVAKLTGEYFVQGILDEYYLIRTCGLFGTAGCWGKGTNFVDAIIRLADKEKSVKVVNDQRITPTSTRELAERTAELIERQPDFGLYHMTNEGDCTWYEFAAAIIKLTEKKAELIPVDSTTFGAKARRPAYSVLENARAKKAGLSDFSPWIDALKAYLISKSHI